jgi:hypothetical protein
MFSKEKEIAGINDDLLGGSHKRTETEAGITHKAPSRD